MTTAGASGKNEQKKETDSKDGGWNLIQWSKGGTDAPESWQWLCWHHAELLVTKQFLVSCAIRATRQNQSIDVKRCNWTEHCPSQYGILRVSLNKNTQCTTIACKLTFVHIFTNYWPIFKILSPATGFYTSHHIVKTSLHYLVKYNCKKT